MREEDEKQKQWISMCSTESNVATRLCRQDVQSVKSGILVKKLQRTKIKWTRIGIQVNPGVSFLVHSLGRIEFLSFAFQDIRIAWSKSSFLIKTWISSLWKVISQKRKSYYCSQPLHQKISLKWGTKNQKNKKKLSGTWRANSPPLDIFM